MSWRMITWLNLVFGLAVSLLVGLVFHTFWGMLAYLPWVCSLVIWMGEDL